MYRLTLAQFLFPLRVSRLLFCSEKLRDSSNDAYGGVLIGAKSTLNPNSFFIDTDAKVCSKDSKFLGDILKLVIVYHHKHFYRTNNNSLYISVWRPTVKSPSDTKTDSQSYRLAMNSSKILKVLSIYYYLILKKYLRIDKKNCLSKCYGLSGCY